MIESDELTLIKNEDYNFLKREMHCLEEVYKQSNDQNIRLCVKERVLFEISDRFTNFYEDYSKLFESCQMSSLNEISNFIDLIMGKYSVEKLSPITEKEAKKILKLKEKTLKFFLKGYNSAISNKNLTYYSQRINDILVYLTKQDNQFIGAVTNVKPNSRKSECLCHFCKQFRRGDDVIFVTTSKTTKDNYSCIGNSVCSDYEMCNKNIESRRPLIKFLKYGLDK